MQFSAFRTLNAHCQRDLWNPRYKGLDDYIWEHMLHKKRET